MPDCEDCGQEVEPGWSLCPNCGHELGTPSADTGDGDDETTSEGGLAETLDLDGEVPEPTTDSPGVSRRAILGLVGIGAGIFVAAGGALTLLDETKHEGAGRDAWVDGPREVTTDTGQALTGRVELAPGEFLAEQFDVAAGAGLALRVRSVDSGGSFDLLTLRDNEIGNYREAGRVEFSSDLSEGGISRAQGIGGNPPAGTYWLVIDNTAVYDAEPNGNTLRVAVTMGVGDLSAVDANGSG